MPASWRLWPPNEVPAQLLRGLVNALPTDGSPAPAPDRSRDRFRLSVWAFRALAPLDPGNRFATCGYGMLPHELGLGAEHPLSRYQDLMLTVNVENEFDPARLRRAIAHLESAVRADPKNLRYRKVLAESYLAARRFDAALEQLRAVWDRRPDPRIAYLLAYTLYRLGELKAAEDQLAEVGQDENVGFSRLHELSGRILHDRGHFAEAVNEFGQALILSPDSPGPKWHMARSLVAHASERGEDRLSLFRRALGLLKSLKPRPGQADEWHEIMGRIYLALHQPVEALRHLERSQRSEGAEKSMLLGLAWLLRGDDAKGRPYLREAVRHADMKLRCVAYLSEIATTPRHLLERMGMRTGHGGIPLFLDHEYLGGIFAPDAPEILEIIKAGTRPRSEAMSRTQAEADPDRQKKSDRLFAPEESRDQSGSTSANLSADEKVTKLIETSPRSSGDRLFPKTMLELDPDAESPAQQPRPKTPKTETLEVEEEDWDIGLDELDSEGPEREKPNNKTEQMAIEEIDDDLDKEGS